MQGQDLGDISEPLLNKYSKKTVNVSKPINKKTTE